MGYAQVKSPWSSRGMKVLLMNEAPPAKTPMLIATATPIFSFLFIWRPQRTVQGSRANAISQVPE
jgi:hypothetical protein